MRVLGVIKKEYKKVIRDKGFILTLIIVPLALMLVFGYTFQSDVKDLNLLVVDEDGSDYSQSIIDAVEDSDYFNGKLFSGKLSEARSKIESGDTRAVLYIPPDLEDNLNNANSATIDIYIDSSDYIIYNVIKGASAEVVKDSIHYIINNLVSELESEQTTKKSEIESIESILDEIDDYADNTIYNINTIKDMDFSKKIQDIKSSLAILSSELPPGSLDDLEVKMAILEQDAESLEVITNETYSDSEIINTKYNTILGKFEDFDLEFTKLNKDFLSMPLTAKETYEFGEVSYFTYLTPAIMTLILFFIGVVLTTTNIVDEKQNGTLYRVSSSPLRKTELLGGKFIVFLIIGFIEALYVLLIAMFIFGVTIAGNISAVLLILLLLMSASIGLGLLISLLVKTMKQAVMLVPLVVIPSVLLSQTFSPLEVMPRFMQYVAYLSPMTYSNAALRAVIIKGESFTSVLSPVFILLAYSLITLVFGIVIFRKRI